MVPLFDLIFIHTIVKFNATTIQKKLLQEIEAVKFIILFLYVKFKKSIWNIVLVINCAD